jgi:hypothetical protein
MRGPAVLAASEGTTATAATADQAELLETVETAALLDQERGAASISKAEA